MRSIIAEIRAEADDHFNTLIMIATSSPNATTWSITCALNSGCAKSPLATLSAPDEAERICKATQPIANTHHHPRAERKAEGKPDGDQETGPQPLRPALLFGGERGRGAGLSSGVPRPSRRASAGSRFRGPVNTASADQGNGRC